MRTVRIYAKALLAYAGTWLAAGLIFVGAWFAGSFVRHRIALSYFPQKEYVHLPPLQDPLPYQPTRQSWRRPPDHLLLNPSHWLVWEENCILGARMDVLKRAGLMPPDWTMNQALTRFPRNDIYNRWGLNWWEKPQTDATLAEIKSQLDPMGGYRYSWHFVQDMNELIELARRGEHVAVHIAIWEKGKKGELPRKKDAGSAFHHALTITGIKWVDSSDGIVEFEVQDPFPFDIFATPTYSAVKSDGFNVFGRQGVPYVGLVVGRAGYVTREKVSPQPGRPIPTVQESVHNVSPSMGDSAARSP